MLQTAMRFSHTLLKEIIQTGDTVVDATMGNGNDTALLAQLVGTNGLVYAFDIQEQALQNTENRLLESGVREQVRLLHQGHETIETAIPEETALRAAIFNLGYLPKSDKQIITKPDTTKQALDALLTRLVSNGRIILVVYYGHAGGEAELALIKEYSQQLPQEEYSVLTYQFINQKNNPPILFCIEKK
ncbi:rRNA methylase [Enterococcus moraviensis ATCC BAA-383]|uniref:rRNA methylase n=1 Tax=Enterococcus moraviensis ATCC BAA-383 TaxID=1158609 RepID=R2TGN6_9ENTE|nr:class I SAM-dependent methyltransferase [Enterococcus moraviensis]EOI06373.1 rRNA methylase [Enterococcus moraviensis ATCC BAA-383]EOT63733.1 rRNA methylase [Enterococcus moraviensis ATCC BAA-383]OJG67137.1 rRNA methylase [Enterococcus moraviensis]